MHCGNRVPAIDLLFSNNTSLVASDKVGLKKGLDVHGEWRVKINVGVSSSIMHIRKKTVERCEVEYVVAEEVIPMVSSYI